MPENEILLFDKRSKTLRRVTVYALIVAAYSVVPVWLELDHFTRFADMPADMHTALALVLGCLLVFRTNTSYQRWWEARQLWGSLVNVSRNLAVKVADVVRAQESELVKFRTEIVAFAYGLRDHLRNEGDVNKLVGFEDCSDSPTHVPSYLITRMYEELGSWKTDGFIDGDELRVLDAEARRFLEICGGCERIRNTRLAQSYRIFARQCVFLYLATFPWGIVNLFHWWTVPITAIIAYFMIGLEVVAEDVEEPFGRSEDDLDLDGLCATIETTVHEIFDRRLSREDDGVVVQ